MRATEKARQLRPTVPGSLMSRLVELASAADGVTQRDAAQSLKIDRISAQSLVKDGVKRGRLFRVSKRLGYMVRFFACPEAAARYWDAPRKPDMPKSKAARGAKLHDVREKIKTTAKNRPGVSPQVSGEFPVRRKTEARDAPVTILRDTRIPSGDAVVPVHVLPSFGVAAGRDPRYQCGPKDKVPPLFSSVPLGSAHTLTGRIAA